MEKVILENGNYTISYYYNDSDESVAKENATKCIICEFDSDNRLIKEARFVIKENKEDNDFGIKLYNNDAYPVFKK